MDKYQIGTNAGIVWNKLKDNAHWDYKQLKAATGLTDRDLNAAIGWLAREEKTRLILTSANSTTHYF